MYIIHPSKNRDNLSSNTLFHFLREFDYLISILNNGFQSNTIWETLPKNRIAYSAQILCFCDIPLGQVKHHMQWYGKYGIGLKKRFLRKRGVSPVFYVHSQTRHINFSIRALQKNPMTPFLKQFAGYVDTITHKQHLDLLEMNKANDPLEIEKYVKRKQKRFYDEREWRFVDKKVAPTIINYSNKDELEYLETDLKYSFSPNFSEVEYLIISGKEGEVEELITVIRGLKISKSEQDLLITKILTTRQIINDF